MKLVNKPKFYTGLTILILLFTSYFINIEITDVDKITNDTLLGIIIFHSPFVLILYIFITIYLIVVGIKQIKII